MTFPLMWRSTHEALLAETQATLAVERQRANKILAVLLRMKQTGAVMTPKHVREAQAPVADPIGVAIEARADGDVRVARHLRVMAQAAQAQGMAIPDIVARIHATSGDTE